MVDFVLLHDEDDAGRAREIVLELDMRGATLSIQDSAKTRLGDALIRVGVWTKRSAAPEQARRLAAVLMDRSQCAILATLDPDAPMDDVARLFAGVPQAGSITELKKTILAGLAGLEGA